MTDVIVVGAGPAGMIAALFAAQGGASVRLVDSNGFAGKKLNLTGKGRCNVTNDCTCDEFMDNVTAGGRFLYSAYNTLPPQEVMRLFGEWGVPLKTERGRRVFPESDNARHITNALTGQLKKRGVHVEKVLVTGLWIYDGKLGGIRIGDDVLESSRVIVATGGLSYPLTGSDGGGYKLARQAGHTVTPTMPSLVPLLSDDPCCAEMQGLSLKNVTLTLCHGEKKLYSELGEMLFTHEGVSGPLVLSASAHMREHGGKGYTLILDIKPGLTHEQLDNRVLRDFGEYSNRDIGNLADGLMPRLLVPVILGRAGINPHTKAHSVTRAQRDSLVGCLKSFDIAISGFAPIEQAVVTSGGVSLKELNPKTMQSKLLDGLYFAGEVIDADAYTGGYNLQIAWCTGATAGIAASSK